MSCGNNMKQIGLASLNHESTYKRLPPSLFVNIGLPPGSTGQPGAPYPAIVHCWSIYLLPYMEQNAIYSAYDQKFPWFSSPSLVPGSPNNQAALKNVIPGFICPSSPGGAERRISGTFSFGATFPFQDFAATDYATCSSINTNSITFFGYASGTTQNDLFSALGHHENDYGLDGAVSGSTTSPGNCVINCHNDNETYSFHTGGATHGLTDGSVRFISAGVSPQIYAALITASGAGRTPAEVSPSSDQ